MAVKLSDEALSALLVKEGVAYWWEGELKAYADIEPTIELYFELIRAAEELHDSKND